MKKLVALSLSMFACACFVNAQNQDNRNIKNFRNQINDSSEHHFQPNNIGMRGFQQKNKIKVIANFHLSANQIKEQQNIHKDFQKQVASLQKNDKISLGEYKTELAILRKNQKEKLLLVLTDEQKNKMAEQKKNREINAQVKSVARLEKMKLTLGLSNDQVTKIKDNQAALRNKIKALHENNLLLPEQKKEALKLLMEQGKELVKSVLTADQQIKADSLKNKMKENFRGGWNKNIHAPFSK